MNWTTTELVREIGVKFEGEDYDQYADPNIRGRISAWLTYKIIVKVGPLGIDWTSKMKVIKWIGMYQSVSRPEGEAWLAFCREFPSLTANGYLVEDGIIRLPLYRIDANDQAKMRLIW